MFNVLCPSCRSFLSPYFQQSKLLRAVHIKENEKISVPVIRYPVGKQQEFIKAKNRKKRKGKLISVPRPGQLLVSTNDRNLNQYTNQFPTKFEPPTLASQTWTSRKSPGRFFILHPTRENPSTSYKENVDFESLGLTSRILTALRDINMQQPTNIQRLVIPEILKGDNVMLAAETGSGKTFGYLLPIMQKLMEVKESGETSSGVSTIILTPSKELSDQVLRMSEELNLPIKVGDLDNFWLQGERGSSGSVDILVGTPILLLASLRKRIISMNNIRFIVVDECDTLLDQSFSKYVCHILGRINIRDGVSKPLLEEKFAQLILSSATFPQYAGEVLEDTIPQEGSFEQGLNMAYHPLVLSSWMLLISKLSAISTGYMHRITPHVTHKFMRLKPSEKSATVMSILKESKTNENGLTMIFCNRKATVDWLADELNSNGIKADKLSGRVDIEDRKVIVQEARTGQTGVLVCTDVSSRGLDTQRIDHVINYDFPNAASDYIHRSGRVGRVGQKGSGKVTSFISRKWEIPLVMRIEEAARRRERIEGVNANIKSRHSNRWEKKFDKIHDAMSSAIE